MQYKEVDRKKLLAKTPAAFWIKVITVGVVGASALLAVSIYFFKGQEIIKFIQKYGIDNRYTNIFENKKADIQDKSLQQHAYSAYLKEKKLYQAQLDKESQQRLERLKETLLKKEQEAKVEVVASTTKKEDAKKA